MNKWVKKKPAERILLGLYTLIQSGKSLMRRRSFMRRRRRKRKRRRRRRRRRSFMRRRSERLAIRSLLRSDMPNGIRHCCS